MKKLALLLSLFIVPLFYASATTENPHNLNKGQFEKDFQELKQLEAHVKGNASTTYREVKNNNPELLEGINIAKSSNAKAMATGFSFSDIEWGPFAWGFCCAPVGFFVVAINDDKSKNEKISFWIGAGVSAVFSLISTIASGGAGA